MLRSPPFDRITLTDNTVLIVDPVSPRPLPAIDPAKEVEAEATKPVQEARDPPGGNIGGPGELSKIEIGGAEKDADTDGAFEHGCQDPLAPGRRRRGTRLQGQAIRTSGKSSISRISCSRTAIGWCWRATLPERSSAASGSRRETRGWPGLDEHVNHVLYAEGSQALIEGDSERGLRLLRELLERKRDYPGLLEQLGNAYGKRIERAIELGLYARGRRILHELEQFAPEAAVVKADARLVYRQGDGSRERRPRDRAARSGSTRWSKRFGSGRHWTGSSRCT